jgi:hypothetical protein
MACTRSAPSSTRAEVEQRLERLRDAQRRADDAVDGRRIVRVRPARGDHRDARAGGVVAHDVEVVEARAHVGRELGERRGIVHVAARRPLEAEQPRRALEGRDRRDAHVHVARQQIEQRVPLARRLAGGGRGLLEQRAHHVERQGGERLEEHLRRGAEALRHELAHGGEQRREHAPERGAVVGGSGRDVLEEVAQVGGALHERAEVGALLEADAPAVEHHAREAAAEAARRGRALGGGDRGGEGRGRRRADRRRAARRRGRGAGRRRGRRPGRGRRRGGGRGVGHEDPARATPREARADAAVRGEIARREQQRLREVDGVARARGGLQPHRLDRALTEQRLELRPREQPGRARAVRADPGAVRVDAHLRDAGQGDGGAHDAHELLGGLDHERVAARAGLEAPDEVEQRGEHVARGAAVRVVVDGHRGRSGDRRGDAGARRTRGGGAIRARPTPPGGRPRSCRTRSA